jgi:hypothetical protein
MSFFVANTFQIQQFHKGLAMQADVAFCFMPGDVIASYIKWCSKKRCMSFSLTVHTVSYTPFLASITRQFL